ncbi:electron transfer flavoprotein subunit beta/FixA family protein [Herbiconiux daphne]|uniref:Electron transfer flavoprotein subunit beta n=1 Tax=Herbiconiux daphne TaxID=2970914 RepID=A0ABT2H3N4_9MICO|nr:electron transfer flavoprotein subunit beta/FixA family protein [Herbiconiux daphne]MCS5734545.1 electron transfer flavoprotein subunit beta/FixA family protein [Herbiconiux daphne]
MKIVVLVKEVPDTYGERKLDLETGLADRDAGDRVLDEIGERAVELAVTLAEHIPGTEVVLLSAGPVTVPASLRKGLAIGASSAVHVLDDRMQGADLTLTAQVLAGAVQRIGFDLVIAGDVSTDGTGGVIPSMVAELLGVASATNLAEVELDDGQLRGERLSDAGVTRLSVALPAVISVTERLPEARFPSFKGIVAAKKKPLDVLTLGEIGVDPDAQMPRSIMVAVAQKPARAAGVTIVDSGDGGTRIAEFLVENRLV